MRRARAGAAVGCRAVAFAKNTFISTRAAAAAAAAPFPAIAACLAKPLHNNAHFCSQCRPGSSPSAGRAPLRGCPEVRANRH
jgi:hypothetical protein